MSGCHSRSPSPNHPSFTNTLSLSEPTTSRPDTHEDTHHLHTTTHPPQHTSHSFRPWTPPRSAEAASASTSALRRSAEFSPEQPKAKRMRRLPSEERAEHNTPSSSSQGDLADTEIDPERSQQTMMSPPTAAPPKKKRTRTLTTPHQSAVLHALLAQSRFPSTAMREEVGRSIGLSARKVQIWFQNQRQKARRPRSQSGAPLSLPQQYTNVPIAPAVDSFDMAQSDQGPSTVGYHSAFGNPSYDTQRFDEHPPRRRLSPAAYMSPADPSSPSQLLGPGMPGSSHRTSRGRDIPVRSPPSFPTPLQPAIRGRHSQSPASLQRHAGGPPHRQDASRTLPPLVFDAPHNNKSDCYPAPAPAPLFSTFDSRRSPPPFARHVPEPPARQPLPMPPPFALQPRWGLAPPPVSSRLGTASWAGTRSYPAAGEGPSAARGPAEWDDPRESPRAPPTLLRERSPPVRAGRYDPVRAAVIPYEGATAPQRPRSAGGSVAYADERQSYERRRRSPSGSDWGDDDDAPRS